MSGPTGSGPVSAPRSRSNAYAFALVITVPLTVALGIWDRLIVAEDATASGALTAARIHIEQVTSLRRDTRKTHVALLESWLAPVDERAARKPALHRGRRASPAGACPIRRAAWRKAPARRT